MNAINGFMHGLHQMLDGKAITLPLFRAISFKSILVNIIWKTQKFPASENWILFVRGCLLLSDQKWLHPEIINLPATLCTLRWLVRDLSYIVCCHSLHPLNCPPQYPLLLSSLRDVAITQQAIEYHHDRNAVFINNQITNYMQNFRSNISARRLWFGTRV